MKDVHPSLYKKRCHAYCSRIDHVELDCLDMTIQGQGMYRQGPQGGPSQQGRPNYPGVYPNYYNNPVVYNNPTQHVGFRKNDGQAYLLPYNYGQQKNSQPQPYENTRQSTYIPSQPPYTQAARPTLSFIYFTLGGIS